MVKAINISWALNKNQSQTKYILCHIFYTTSDKSQMIYLFLLLICLLLHYLMLKYTMIQFLVLFSSPFTFMFNMILFLLVILNISLFCDSQINTSRLDIANSKLLCLFFALNTLYYQIAEWICSQTGSTNSL